MTTATAPGEMLPGDAPTRTGTSRALPPVLPGRDDLIDALAITALTVIGIYGFRAAYGGTAYLVAGLAGVVLGLLLSHLGMRARVPLLGITALGVIAFVLLGGLISAGMGMPGMGSQAAPTLATMHAVIATSINGWKQLLTTAQPVGSAAHLLVLPYLLGLASGVMSHALARRTKLVVAPALPAAAVVALSILFGPAHAAAAVLQGAGFAVICLAWAASRQQRGTRRITAVGRQRPWQRLAAGTTVLAVAAGGAVLLGPRLPGAGDHGRVVLHEVPPFNVNQYPSPLSGFRVYTKGAVPGTSLYGKELLSTTGLPAGERVRIAAMDSYDGLAWGVANAQASATTFAGFQQVGMTLPSTGSPGASRSATITIEDGYQLPWLPDLAGTRGFGFAGMTGFTVESELRYNVATITGVVPGGLPAGFRYTVTAAPAGPDASQLGNATPWGAPDSGITIPAAATTFANAHSGGAGTPMGKVLALAAYLKDNGKYSDGGGGQAVLPGNGAGRLTTFLESDLTGDDEQYAAAMALLANAVGVPARVALDGTVEPDGSIYGRDVHADVELDLAQYGWVTLPIADFLGSREPSPLPRQQPQPFPAKAVPQQQPVAAPVSGNSESTASSRAVPPRPKDNGFRLPHLAVMLLTDIGIPLAALLAIGFGLAGAKGLRRRRRRRGAPAASVAGAWQEIVDLGRDLGISPEPSLTRREQAARYAPGVAPAPPRDLIPGAAGVAVAADAAAFGPADPDRATATQVWKLVSDARRGALKSLPRWRRSWVAISPVSLVTTR